MGRYKSSSQDRRIFVYGLPANNVVKENVEETFLVPLYSINQ